VLEGRGTRLAVVWARCPPPSSALTHAVCKHTGEQASGWDGGEMSDLVANTAGGKVYMVSSLDPAHPGENIIDGRDGTYWISTGLYPQEILLGLARPARVSSVRLFSTRVRSVRFECCQGTPVNFSILAECEVEDAQDGCLQIREVRCGSQEQPTDYVRLMILSGWDDFCSVHRIQVDGVVEASSPQRRAMSKRATGAPATHRDSVLEVSVPGRMPKEDHEPDAPRKPDRTSPWRDG